MPSAHLNCVGILIASFRSSILSSPIPLFTLRCAPHDTQRKTRGRVDRYSFLVRILHSLLHAGCSENTHRLIVSGGVDSELSLIPTEKPRRLRHRK